MNPVLCWSPRYEAALALAARTHAAHNLATTLAEVAERGPQVWQKFKRPEQLQWYYQQIALLAQTHLPGHALTAMYAALVAALEQFMNAIKPPSL